VQRFVLNNTVQHCSEELVNLNNENYNKQISVFRYNRYWIEYCSNCRHVLLIHQVLV